MNQYFQNILKNKELIYKSAYKGWYCPVDECFYQNKDLQLSADESHRVIIISLINLSNI